MLRNVITAVAGRKVAQKMGGGALGAAAAAALPFVARRGLGPLGAALTAGWAVNKALEWRRKAKARRAYPQAAAPINTPPAQTATPS